MHLEATDMKLDEEISSIAHKIRDLMDPDALFLLVRGKEGLRLVARSSTDDVDVSQVALLFGGGGHARASAALIHADDELLRDENAAEMAITRIIDFLKKNIKPSLTVAQDHVKEAFVDHKSHFHQGSPVIDAALWIRRISSG